MSLARRIERAKKPNKKELAEQVEKALDEKSEEILADFLLMLLAWLRCERKFGKKRLTRTLKDFVDFLHVNGGKVNHEEIAAMLKEETGLDLLEMARQEEKAISRSI